MPQERYTGKRDRRELTGQVSTISQKWPGGIVSERYINRWLLPNADGKIVYEAYVIGGPREEKPPQKIFNPLETDPVEQQALEIEYNMIEQERKNTRRL